MNLKKHLPWLGALLPIANTQAETKPNVVIIYIDDMGITKVRIRNQQSLLPNGSGRIKTA